MSEAKESENSTTDEENARVGYQAAIDLWTYHGQLNWNRFNVMLVANSIILATTGVAFTSQRPLPVLTAKLPIVGLVSLSVFTTLLPILGLAMCAAWFLLTARGYDFREYWAYSAIELEEKYLASSVRTVSRYAIFRQGKPVSLEVGGTSTTRRMRLWARWARSERWISYLVIFVFVILYMAALLGG